jgi:threonine dehydrogenase-like Zn-dependent dehydrogenase
MCREGRYGQCLEGGGWVLGHRIDGTQAEYVPVPYADTSTYRIPDGVADEAMLMLADILPAGYEVGVLAGGVRPGDVVVVVGAGPVGLSAIASARLFSPANIGVHGSAALLHLEKEWARNITITTGLVDASSTPTLMRLVASGQLDAARFVTHRFDMSEFDKAYEICGNADSGALKVVLTRGEGGADW